MDPKERLEELRAELRAERARGSSMNEKHAKPRGAIASWLRTINPNEPGGDWSVYDLMQASGLSEEEVRSDLEELRPFTGGGRYVGGTSGHLYSLPSES